MIAGAGALGLDLCLALMLPFGSISLARSRWRRWSIASALVGGGAGTAAGLAAGLISMPPRLGAETIVGAAIGFGLLNLGPTSPVRRLVAGATIAALALTGIGLASAGATPSQWTAASASGRAAGSPAETWGPTVVHAGAGYPGVVRWRIPTLSASSGAAGTVAEPTSGEVGSVIIPPTRSGFRARPAIVYLPPAALRAHAPRLPLVIALSGQSRGAGPTDVIEKGHIASIMNGIARTHHGVAPIVVVPDQLGPQSGNPMCIDSPLGRVATYITVDVRRWILTHLPVASDRRDWTIAGFSEGGTCSIQFGAGRPDLFGSLVDVSGEQAPVNGTVAHTIDVGFGGSAAAYAAASPFHLLAVHHYSGMRAFFTAGGLDRHLGPVAPVMAKRAQAAGMAVHYRVLQGLRHNWLTGYAGLAWGLDALDTWWPAEAAAERRS